jgi:hypothetical protein
MGLACLALPMAAQATIQAKANTRVESSQDRISTRVELETKARVVRIDKTKRVLHLRQEDGERIQLVAGPELGNFEAVKVGDQLSVRYSEQLTLRLIKGAAGVREKVESEASSVAKPGQAPGSRQMERSRSVYDVVAKDEATQTLTLRGVKGNIERKVEDPARFAQVAVGDQVVVLLTKGLALTLSPAPR